jgi:hypothetical protein
MGWTTRVRFPTSFSLLTASRPSLGLTQTLIQCVPEVKRPGREVDQSPSSSAEVKNGGAVPPLPKMSSGHSV